MEKDVKAVIVETMNGLGFGEIDFEDFFAGMNF
jgi:hypothetical protein